VIGTWTDAAFAVSTTDPKSIRSRPSGPQQCAHRYGQGLARICAGFSDSYFPHSRL